MIYEIEKSPEYAYLTVEVPAGELLKVEAAAMATMDTHFIMTTKMTGAARRFLTKESFFINEFVAKGKSGKISIAPGPMGDIGHCELEGETIYLVASSFVASTENISYATKWQGIGKGFFSGAGLFLVRCSGNGHLWFSTYGALFAVDVRDDYLVDSGHVVAFTEGLEYEVSKMGGYKSFLFSGEGFVCRFKGEGKVWIQTKNPQALVSWADQYRIVVDRRKSKS